MTESVINSPYRGLTPYTEADAAYFFGRTAEIATITANLEVARLTLLYGPSGVGKTSVLRAGVLHGLQEQARANQVALGRPEIIPVYFSGWQGEPLLGLTQQIQAATLQLYQGAPPVPDLLMEPTPPLLLLLAQIGEQTGSDLLIVLDQFEEYFLYHPNESGPDSFAHHLIQAVNSSHLRANFLLSLREDALARLDYFKGRIPALLDNRLSIGHLDRAAGYEAVVKPLERFNQDQQTTYTIEPDLVEAVLDQVGSGKVALSKQGAGGWSEKDFFAVTERIEAPYLQLVLIRLWKQEQTNGSNQLRYDTLDELGGATRIVRNYLDSTLATLAPEELALVARFFDRLVTPSGTKIALTIDELMYYVNANRSAIEHVVQQLQARRLLRSIQTITGINQYEIFHDVLGEALLDWQARYLADVSDAERLVTEQAARSTAEAQAKTEVRRAHRTRLTLAGLLLLLLLILYVTSWALQTYNTALNNQRVEIALRRTLAENLTVQSQLLMNHDQESSDEKLILARDAVLITMLKDDYITANAYMALHNLVATTSFAEQPQDAEYSIIYSVAFSPDGQYIISGGDDHIIYLWNAMTGVQIVPLLGHQKRIYTVAFSPDGQRIASGGEDGNLQIWLVPQQLVLQAMSRISRKMPILTDMEKEELGLDAALELPDQTTLNSLMIQSQGLGLIEQGRTLARTGSITEAVARFEAAMAIDPTLQLEPEPLARRVLSNRVQALLFAGRQAAQAGQLETALAKLTEAAALQPTLNQEALAAEFRQLAASVTPSPTVTGTATVVAPLSPLATPTPRATAVGP